MDQVLLEQTPGQRKKKVTGNSQHWFTNGKSCVTYFIASVKVTEFVGKGRAVDFMYFDSSRSFDNASPQYSCIQDRTNGEGEQTTRLIKKHGWMIRLFFFLSIFNLKQEKKL